MSKSVSVLILVVTPFASTLKTAGAGERGLPRRPTRSATIITPPSHALRSTPFQNLSPPPSHHFRKHLVTFPKSPLPIPIEEQGETPLPRRRHVPDHHPVPGARARGGPGAVLQGRQARPHVVAHGRHRAAPLLLLQGGHLRRRRAASLRAPRARRPQGPPRHPPGPHLHLGRPAQHSLLLLLLRRRRRRLRHRPGPGPAGRARGRGAPQVPPRARLPRARRARHAAPVRGVARRVRRRRRRRRGPRVQGPGGRGGVHARVGPGGPPGLLQRLRRVPRQGHVRPRLRRRRPPRALPPVAGAGHGARRARAQPQAGGRQRHHTGHRPQGHAQARAPRGLQPDPIALPGQLPGDGRPQGVHQRAVVLLGALLHDLALPHGAHQEQVRHRAGGQRRRDAVQVHPAGASAGAVRRPEPRRRAGERTAQAGVRVHHQGRREGLPRNRRHRGRCNYNMGPGRRRLGPRVRRGVRAGGGGELHAVRGEDADGAGHRRRAGAQHIHGEGGRQDGAVHRQLGLQEEEGRRVPVLRAQAVRVVRPSSCPDTAAGGLLAGCGDGRELDTGWRAACLVQLCWS